MKKTHYLEEISSPEDLRRLPREAMGDLATEIRRFLVERVKEHGGHLASNPFWIRLSGEEVTLG